MVVLYAVTIWLLGAAFLLFPILGLPRRFGQAAMTLLVAELAAVMIESYSRPGGLVADASASVASLDVPALGLLLFGFAIATSVRASRAHERGSAAGEVTRRSRSER